MNYLKQRAVPWVSFSVLAGGLLSALILLWLTRIEAEFHVTITSI